MSKPLSQQSGILLVLAFVSSCSVLKKDDDSSPGQGNSTDNTSYTYSYNDNGCETGEHVLTGLLAYCKALSDDALNNGCAAATRKQNFDAQCKDLVSSGQIPDYPKKQSSRGNSSDDNDNDDNDNRTPPDAPASIGKEIKDHTVSFVIKDQTLVNKISETTGGSGSAYIQNGKILNGSADLTSGAGGKYCSVKGLLFTSLNIPYKLEAAKSKEQRFFANAIFQSTLEETISMECEKISSSIISLSDLEEVFGSLAAFTK